MNLEVKETIVFQQKFFCSIEFVTKIILTEIIFYHTFFKRQNTKMITKIWEWHANIITGISLKGGDKISFLVECYSNENFLQEWKFLLKPDHFILYNSLLPGLCTTNMYSIYKQKFLRILM